MAAVEFEVKDGVAVMTLNRPEAKNALDGAIFEGLRAGYAEINRNPEIRVGVLTGAGGTFCSGMDLKAFVRGEKMDSTGVPYGGKANVVVEKPTIAAVEGYAVAGGFELALTCDMIVAARSAKFGIPEVRRGLCASGGGLVKLPRQATLRVAMEMALTGDFYDAESLQQRGVINRVTPDGEALKGALELAAKIAANGPLAVAASRKVILASLEWPVSEAMDRQKEITVPVRGSNDAREGATAFAEKRPPRWTGT